MKSDNKVTKDIITIINKQNDDNQDFNKKDKNK
jgi:hypothetical protein